jgi:pimeloyl-ACP methyl ester carboxylesterase
MHFDLGFLGNYFIYPSFFFNFSDLKMESIYGNWKGEINAAGAKVPISFSINEDSKHTLTASLFSQGQPIKADNVSRENCNLFMEFNKIKAKFQGKFIETTSTIVGIWSQANQDFDLSLQKTQTTIEPLRPQVPHKPYPYVEKNVKYPNSKANLILGGTLTFPSTPPPYPAVILISGSGAEDRDETIFGHKPFLILADYLTRRGIAVLRVDDRGVGESTGKYEESTNADFVSDVIAGVEFLKMQKEINPNKIGLIGHSEGGVIAPLVASKNPDITFIVLMAGSGLPLEQILYMQGELIARTNHVSEELISMQHHVQEIMFSHIKNEKNLDKARQKIRKAVTDEFKAMKEKKLPTMSEDSINAQIQMVLSPWFRDFLAYDPKEALRKVKCPVLALNGEKDLQVPPKENLAAIKEALQSGGNTNFKVIEIPNLNHLFQTANTGALTEYAQIEETISPKALQIIGDWLMKQI